VCSGGDFGELSGAGSEVVIGVPGGLGEAVAALGVGAEGVGDGSGAWVEHAVEFGVSNEAGVAADVDFVSGGGDASGDSDGLFVGGVDLDVSAVDVEVDVSVYVEGVASVGCEADESGAGAAGGHGDGDA